MLFRTATEWVAALSDARRAGPLEDELARHARIPLLIVDELRYIPFDPEGRQPHVHARQLPHERASMIGTSNKPFSAWGEIFGDDMVAAAIIDRLVHPAEIVALKATPTGYATATSATPNPHTPPNSPDQSPSAPSPRPAKRRYGPHPDDPAPKTAAAPRGRALRLTLRARAPRRPRGPLPTWVNSQPSPPGHILRR